MTDVPLVTKMSVGGSEIDTNKLVGLSKLRNCVFLENVRNEIQIFKIGQNQCVLMSLS